MEYNFWFNLVQGFQRRRSKCESLRRTTDGQTDDDRRQVMAKAHMALARRAKKSFTPKRSPDKDFIYLYILYIIDAFFSQYKRS
jgi:hypothetical protein